MLSPSATSLSDQEVLRRIQYLGDTLAAATARTQGRRPSTSPHHHRRPSHDDWEQQLATLEELALLFSDAVAGRLPFVGWVSLYLKNSLAAALQSLRPAVSLAAMAVLSCLSVHASADSRAAITTVCSWFLGILLRLAAGPASARAVAAAARQLLLTLAATSLLSLEGLNLLCAECAAGSAAVRRLAVEVLQAYLEAARGTEHQLALSAYAGALHRVVRDGVRDADAEVRAAARRCFWALHLMEPASTADLLRTLPPGVQLQLAAERDGALQSLNAVAAVPSSSATAATIEGRRGSRNRGREMASGVTDVSRTLTLKDELQAAAASRARAQRSRSSSLAQRHHQLLLTSKDLPYDPDRRPVPVQDSAVRADKPPRRPRQSSLLASIESTDWSVRRAALLRIARQCESVEGLDAEGMDGLAAAVLLRLQDTHFRVAEAAQECLRRLWELRPAATQDATAATLPEFLLALLRNTAHSKASVRDGARLLLHLLLSHHPSPSRVLETLLQRVDDVRSCAVEQHAAEFAAYIVLSHPSLLRTESATGLALRAAVARVSAADADMAKDGHHGAAEAVRRSWGTFIAAMALLCPDVFVDAAHRLSPSQKELVCRSLKTAFLGDASSVEITGPVQVVCVFAQELQRVCDAEEARLRGTAAVTSAAQREGLTRLPRTHVISVDRVPPVLCALLGSTEDAKVEAASASATSPPAPPVDAAVHRQAVDTATTRAPEHAHSGRDGWDGVGDGACGGGPGNAVWAVCAEAPPTVSAAPREAPSHFLEQWPQCCDGASKRAALSLLTATLALHGRRARNAFASASSESGTNDCVAEDVERLLLCWEREVALAEAGGDHQVRCGVFAALEALLSWPAARRTVARLLTRVLLLCRCGLDDSFLEAQLLAARCLHAAVMATSVSADLCLGAVASCVERWIDGPWRDGATLGWVEMLLTMRRLLFRARGLALGGGGAELEVRASSPGPLTSSVLRRVVAVATACLFHCHPAVRLSGVKVLAALQHTIGSAAAEPFLSKLTPVHSSLVQTYADKLDVAVEAN